jgi:hypothetical protein
MPKLQITLFWCRDAEVEKHRSMTIIWACREIAGRHGLELEFHPAEIRPPSSCLALPATSLPCAKIALASKQ